MPRSNRPRRRSGGARPDDGFDPDRALSGMQRHEDHPDGGWLVRQVSGSRTGPARSYVCPGCQQQVPSTSPHVVAWPSDTLVGEGLDQRRHWHTACWRARDRRRPR